MADQGMTLGNSASIGGQLIKRKKNINIQEAENGYTLSLGYNEIHIATNKAEALEIISQYLDRKED